MGRRGRENLQIMKKDTFGTERDQTGKCYIYQKHDETDKNHTEADTDMFTQGRI